MGLKITEAPREDGIAVKDLAPNQVAVLVHCPNGSSVEGSLCMMNPYGTLFVLGASAYKWDGVINSPTVLAWRCRPLAAGEKLTIQADGNSNITFWQGE